jgi:hypothetical protein
VVFDHVPPVLGDRRCSDLGHEGMHGRKGADLVLFHHARRADDIGDEDGGEAARQPFRIGG